MSTGEGTDSGAQGESAAPVGTLKQLSGRRSFTITWAELDADYALKLPALFHPCLDVCTAALSGAFDLFGLARRGIAPITLAVELAAGGAPIALGRPLEQRYEITLRRAQLPPTRPGAAGAAGAPRERLLLDQRIALHGFRRSGGATDLGYDDGSGEALEAGSFRLVQVFTRPFGASGERAVRTVPLEFAALREQPWEGPLPTAAWLGAGVEGGTELAVPGVLPYGRVWGRGHTDINHHVTVVEYLRLLELAQAAGVHAAGLNVARHRLARMQCVFQRPFFAGERCAVQGRLLQARQGTWLLGGIHRRGLDGTLERDPSIAARLEGELHPGEGA